MAISDMVEWIYDLFDKDLREWKRRNVYKPRTRDHFKITECQNPSVARDNRKKYKRKRRFTIKRIIKFFRKKLRL